ncbi:MAG TPA: cell division protein ZapE [Hyphomicrobiaceae bacterium]|nr:cell division protein ZapE [Hyphomicrobiaceae bacterium]
MSRPENSRPEARYAERVARGEIEHDVAQAAIVAQLGALGDALATWRPQKRWSLSQMFGAKARPPRGLYIHGAVGRGKTMLMDLFFDAVAIEPRRRIHFHEFMAEVHDRIATARKTVEGDPIPHVAREIAEGASLLCFDELHVTDIADAMILGRLFAGLFVADVVVVATSNSSPGELYRNGLNRQLFLPFIAMIEERLDVAQLDAAKDFRLEKLAGLPLYFSPADADARRALSKAFQRLTGVPHGAPLTLDVKGRAVIVPEAASGVARFTFDELCDTPLGSLDYLHIAHAFHTVIIDSVPLLVPERRAAARRFINLIDTLYDNCVGLIVSAAAEPHELHTEGKEAQLFERTASRLVEMRSEAYLGERARRHDDLAAE